MAKWTAQHEAPEPFEGPVVGTVMGGTIIWFVLFVVQLPFYGWFADRDLLWWVWTCAAGGFLGLIGLWYVRGRDAALTRHADALAARGGDGPAGTAGPSAAGPGAGPGPGTAPQAG